MAVTFDTLQFVHRLKKAGINEPEAEAIAEAVRDVRNELDVKVAESGHGLVTKQDLALTERALRQDLELMERGLRQDMSVTAAQLEAKIAETRAELVKWVVSVGVLQASLIAALIMKLVPG